MSGGDIWSTGAFTFESPLKDLLDSENYTLEDLLSEDELLQELRGLHPTLVSFFSSEENVAGLIRCLVNPPLTFQEFLFMKAKQDEEGKCADTKIKNSSESNVTEPSWLLDKTSETRIQEAADSELNPREEYENSSIRFPYMACEIICCEVPSILDIIVYGYAPPEKSTDISDGKFCETLLDLLFSVLFKTPEYQLDDRRSGYLEKVVSVLFRTRQDAMTSYINGDHFKENTDSESVNQFCNVPKHHGGGEALLRALFKQLHSNSITQIVQHMFMPKQQHYIKREEHQIESGTGPWESSESDENGCELDFFCGINCNWSDSDVGLTLLLERLFVDLSSLNEAQLNASQHSCEILTLVIQHSQLDSAIIKTMTSEPILPRLIHSACGSRDSTFSVPHAFLSCESSMTTAMNVLEILILQVGGYGTVVTGQHGDANDENVADLTFDSNNGKSNLVHTLNIEHADQIKISVAQSLILHLPSFLECLSGLLMHPDAPKWTSYCQFSEIQQPMLGLSRLRIVRLIESVVLLSIREVDLILCESECLEICLDLFWKFPWCSMLHQSVANLLVHVLEGGEDRIDLQMYFLHRCNLPQRLMDSFKNDTFLPYANLDQRYELNSTSNGLAEQSQNTIERITADLNIEHSVSTQAENKKSSHEKDWRKNVSFRMGYMGHVIIICQALLHACDYENSLEQKNEGTQSGTCPSESVLIAENKNVTLMLLQKMTCYSDWLSFVSTTLTAETSLQSTPLGASSSIQSNDTVENKTKYSWNVSSDLNEGTSDHVRHQFILSSEEIDLDDTDLDIAASMMESMNLPASEENDKGHGHRRQRGVISGQDTMRATGFGTVVDIFKGSTDYDFDDPLGSNVQFEMDNDEEKDDHENDGDDDGAPVIDLFAGNFDNLDTGWANFDNAFADAISVSDREDFDLQKSSNYTKFEDDSNSSDSDEG